MVQTTFYNNGGLLGGGFKYFLFSPRSLGKWSNLTSIVFRWVGSTTNQFSRLKLWSSNQLYRRKCKDIFWRCDIFLSKWSRIQKKNSIQFVFFPLKSVLLLLSKTSKHHLESLCPTSHVWDKSISARDTTKDDIWWGWSAKLDPVRAELGDVIQISFFFRTQIPGFLSKYWTPI